MQQGREGRPSRRTVSVRLHVVILVATLAWLYPNLRAQPADTSTAVYSFDIPAQSLSSALRQFAQQSRREILFTPGLVAGKKSSGVVGSMPPTQALEALLKNCGITWSTTSAGTLLLHEQPKSRAVDQVKESV